jgi:hypothetical protein
MSLSSVPFEWLQSIWRVCNSISKLRKLGFGTGAQDILKHQVHVRARGHIPWHSGPVYAQSQHVIVLFCTLSCVRLRKGPYNQMATPDWPVDRSLAMAYWHPTIQGTFLAGKNTQRDDPHPPASLHLRTQLHLPQKERLGLAIFHFLYYPRLIGLRSHYYECCDLLPVF